MTTTTVSVTEDTAVASHSARRRYSGGPSASTLPRAVAVPESQLYYWTSMWQRQEAQALRELRSGQAERFETSSDAIRWLLSD